MKKEELKNKLKDLGMWSLVLTYGIVVIGYLVAPLAFGVAVIWLLYKVATSL